MAKQKDRHLESPGEANRDKHINFLAEEQGDPDPASENFDENAAACNSAAGVDNGFFTADDNGLQSREKIKMTIRNSFDDKNGKPTPSDTEDTKTAGDKIGVNKHNYDLGVTDGPNGDYKNEDDQAH